MKDLEKIESTIYFFAKQNNFRWVIPQLSYGAWAADFICYSGNTILEIEIKRSWGDYKAEAKKVCNDRIQKFESLTKKHKVEYKKQLKDILPPLTKREWLLGNYEFKWKPTHFAYAAPFPLANKILKDSNLCKFFGVIAIVEDPIATSLAIYLKYPKRIYIMNSTTLQMFKEDVVKKAFNIIDSHFRKFLDIDEIK